MQIHKRTQWQPFCVQCLAFTYGTRCSEAALRLTWQSCSYSTLSEEMERKPFVTRDREGGAVMFNRVRSVRTQMN